MYTDVELKRIFAGYLSVSTSCPQPRRKKKKSKHKKRRRLIAKARTRKQQKLLTKKQKKAIMEDIKWAGGKIKAGVERYREWLRKKESIY